MIVDYRCCFSGLSVSFPWNITAEPVDYRCNESAQTASPIGLTGSAYSHTTYVTYLFIVGKKKTVS